MDWRRVTMTEIKFEVTEEQVREAVMAIVREEMGRMGEGFGLRAVVRDSIGSAVDALVEEKLRDRLDAIADETLAEHMEKPFTVTDGWGRSAKTFDTYDDFIRYKLRERFDSDEYKLRNKFHELMKKKVDKVWDEFKNDAIAQAMAKVEALEAVE